MLSQPLLAHPAEIGGVHATRIHGMPTIVTNAVKRPTINNIWLAP
jgi:hypothetical protein